MKHWRVEINFEAWDDEDARRMLLRMTKPVDAESRLLYATTPIETRELAHPDAEPETRPDEWAGSDDPAVDSDVSIYGAGSQ